MKKFLYSLLLVLSLVSLGTSAFAQGGMVDRSALAAFTGNGSVYYICTYAATGTPCSPTQAIYQDKGLSVSISQSSGVPIGPDGRIRFFVTPGLWQIQYKTANGQYYSDYVVAPADVNSATNGLTDGAFYVPPSDCYSAVSGNASGTNGLTVSGTSNTPVIQASTSSTGTNTHTYVCVIHPPTRLTSGKGISVTDVTFFYGVQTSALGTQVATLASGTMNSSTVFGSITFPAAGASETASTVAPVRADSGTLTITPAVGSFNTATTTAGAFYSVKFTPASSIAMTTDLQELVLTVTLQCAGTSATVTNSPGLLVHYTNNPF